MSGEPSGRWFAGGERVEGASAACSEPVSRCEGPGVWGGCEGAGIVWAL